VTFWSAKESIGDWRWLHDGCNGLDVDRKKERVAWLDPTRAIGRKSTSRHHAMHMWVKFEFLTPGVQHAAEANFCAKMLGIAGDFEKRFGAGAEQEIVDDLLILKSQWG